jgi:REP element-mobilizing transposase RayT
VLEEWERTALIRREIELDEFIIMPNHLHAIVIVGAHRRAPSQNNPSKSVTSSQNNLPAQNTIPLERPPRSLGALIAGFKSASTKRINRVRETPGIPIWQRNYYEHIIRDESGLNSIRQYIQTNPAQWANDEENPAKVK